MSLKYRGTIFPQARVQRNFSDNFKKISKTFASYEDAATFFMLADATCSKRPKVDIEKIHVSIFKNLEIPTLKNTTGLMETLEILQDAELMHDIQESREQARQGKVVSWEKTKVTV